MLRFRAVEAAALAVLMALVAGCSREQQDWRAAEAADSIEGYSQFLQRHPESELATEARTRVTQLGEEHEWQQAGHTDTADAYRQFLAQHPNGKWSQEARIRIQNFALSGLPPAGPPMAAEESATGSAVSGAAGGGGSDSYPPMSGSAALASGSAAAASNAAVAAASAAPAKATASDAARSVAAPGELAQAPGTARVTPAPEQNAIAVPAKAIIPIPAVPGESAAAAAAHAPAIALATPYVSVPTGASGYGVQLGAFTNEGAANSAWQQLTARFGQQLQGLSAHVVAANTATGPLFRLQAPVGDEGRARALCDTLRKQSQACVLVLPH